MQIINVTKLTLFTEIAQGVGILVYTEPKEQVVEVKMMNDETMAIKLELQGLTITIICAYAPQGVWMRRSRKALGRS